MSDAVLSLEDRRLLNPAFCGVLIAATAAGHERVVVFGLCASAWIALRAVLDAPVAGVIALNPQLYWKPGDPRS